MKDNMEILKKKIKDTEESGIDLYELSATLKKLIPEKDRPTVNKEINEAMQAMQKQPFPNMDIKDPDVFGIQQAVKASLSIAQFITPEEFKIKKSDAEYSDGKVEFEKDGRGIIVNLKKGYGLNPIKNSGQELISTLEDIGSAEFLQDVLRVFYYLIKHGRWELHDKTINILKETNGYTGERCPRGKIKRFSNNLILANRTQVYKRVEEIKYGKGKTYKIKANEIAIKPCNIFDITFVFAKDKNGNPSYAKAVYGGALPDFKEKSSFAIAMTSGFFRLNGEMESNRIFMAAYFVDRFSQNLDNTIKGMPLKIDRRFLVKIGHYEKSDRLNKKETSKMLTKNMERFTSLGIIGDWEMSDGSKVIPTQDNSIILIYPPKKIMESLVSKNIKSLKKGDKE